MIVKVSTGVTRARGHKGARVRMRTLEGARWHGEYQFDTHGLSEAEIAAKVDVIRERHSRKEDRLDEYASVYRHAVEVAGERFVITDCRMIDVGPAGGVVELTVHVRRENGPYLARPWFPFVIPARDMADLPSAEDVKAIVTARLHTMLGDFTADEQILANLRRIETS